MKGSLQGSLQGGCGGAGPARAGADDGGAASVEALSASATDRFCSVTVLRAVLDCVTVCRPCMWSVVLPVTSSNNSPTR
jgi:hypothetical protein